MAEPLNEQRKIPGLISNNDRAPQSGFPFGIIVVAIFFRTVTGRWFVTGMYISRSWCGISI